MNAATLKWWTKTIVGTALLTLVVAFCMYHFLGEVSGTQHLKDSVGHAGDEPGR